MPSWSLWGTVAVFGAYLAYVAIHEAVKVRRVWRRERALTEDARRQERGDA
jgi:hypothetical protein